MEKELSKIGYYTIYEIKVGAKVKYKVDSGKLLYVAKFKKYIANPYRDVKEFTTLTKAKEYVLSKLKKGLIEKQKKLDNLPKSLYLILMKEESSGVLFVKVGITSKKFLMRRFSKKHGYKGYIIDSVLRRIDTPYAEKLEEEIKEKIKKKKSIKKYRPLLESFSGYSECFNHSNLDEIVKIFDECVKKY